MTTTLTNAQAHQYLIDHNYDHEAAVFILAEMHKHGAAFTHENLQQWMQIAIPMP